ncbi:MAG: DUF86 domain-containing protein [Betaproteobacteria bacterium]|nr:DUF86 domain-containing protein [Betaproteobacteria bacterium]
MHADARKLLWDARQAADRVAQYTAGKSFADYLVDDMLRSAVERQFEIIGEAFSQLRRVDPATAAAIPELPHIVAFRNILIHGYASVDNRLVWGVVEANLASLRAVLERLLAQA